MNKKHMVCYASTFDSTENEIVSLCGIRRKRYDVSSLFTYFERRTICERCKKSIEKINREKKQ